MDWDDGYMKSHPQYPQRSLRPTSYYSQPSVSPPNHLVPYGQLVAPPGPAPTVPFGSGYQHLAVGPYQRDYYSPPVSRNPHQLPPYQQPEEFYEYFTGSRNNQYFPSQPEVPLGRVSDATIVNFLDQDCIEPIIDLLSRMADPLSITASIITVASVGIKLSTALYTLVDSIRSANIEIELLAESRKDKNSKLESRASHRLLTLQRRARQNRSRAEALVIANYWAISRSEEAAQEANYQALLTQDAHPNNSDSTETNQWLRQLVPYKPPQKPSQPSGHRHVLMGTHGPPAPSKNIHSVASKTVNLLLNDWTNSTKKSEDMKNGHSSSRRADTKTESRIGDVYSDSGESEDEESILSLNEFSKIGSPISGGKKDRSNERSSSQDKDIERKPVIRTSTGEGLKDRAETGTVDTDPPVKMEQQTPDNHEPSAKDIPMPEPFSDRKSHKRTDNVRRIVMKHASKDQSEIESALTGPQISPILETLSISSNSLDSEEDNSDDINPSDSASVVERRRSRRKLRRSPNSSHRSARSTHSDSVATPKPYSPMYGVNPGFGPSAHFPGPPQMQYGPANLAAPLPYQAPFPQFPDYAVPPPIRAPSPQPPAPSETAKQIERIEKILAEYIAREAASKEATEAVIAQERHAKAVQEKEKELEEAKLAEVAKKQAEEEAKKQNQKNQILSLKDAIGRKFRFPFYQSNTWEVS
ncbi:MAG: hypothetical protein Q9167_005143 [Letrouitia subvulpina]